VKRKSILNHDHRQLCKHASLNSPGMKLIFEELNGVIDQPTSTETGSSGAGVGESTQLNTSMSAMRLGESALVSAVAAGNFKVVERLISNGADCNSQDL
jgi:hypothetical protein